MGGGGGTPGPAFMTKIRQISIAPILLNYSVNSALSGRDVAVFVGVDGYIGWPLKIENPFFGRISYAFYAWLLKVNHLLNAVLDH